MVTLTVVVAVWLAARSSLDAWRQQAGQQQIALSDIRWGWLGLAGLAYTLSLVPSCLVLRQALGALRQSVALPLVIAAQLLGHIAKYVPGKALVVVVRASILSRGQTKVSLKLAAIAVVIETLNLVAVGAVLALFLLMLLDVPDWILWTCGAMAAGATLVTSPPVLRLALSHRLRRSSGQWSIEAGTEERSTTLSAPLSGGADAAATSPPRRRLIQPIPLDWSTSDLVVSWFWCAVSWFWTGMSMTAVVLALVPMPADQTPVSLAVVCSAAIMLAFVVGFASLLPGGAAVREVVLATLLTPVITAGPALMAAIVARLVQLAVESVLATAIWIMLARAGRHGDASPEVCVYSGESSSSNAP